MKLEDLTRGALKTLFMSIVLTACSQQTTSFHRISADLLISNATVIDIETGDKTTKDIFISGDHITAVLPHNSDIFNKYSESMSVIDASGQYAIPGLWDMHVHLTKPGPLVDTSSALYIANGVTSVRDMGGVLKDILAFREISKQPGSIAPQIWIAGPMIDGVPVVFDGVNEKPAMAIGISSPADAIVQIDKLAAQGVDFIKVYETLRPEVFSAIVAQARVNGLPVDGHIPMRMTVTEAVAAGQAGIAHMKGVDYGCARDPAALKAERVALLDAAAGNATGQDLALKVFSLVVPKAMAQQNEERCNALIQYFATRGTWHTPGLSTEHLLVGDSGYIAQWREGLKYLPSVAQKEKEAAELFRQKLRNGEITGTIADFGKILLNKHDWKFELVWKMHQAGVPLLAGTDAPYMLLPGFGLHMELAALVKAGLSPLHALQTATINGARFFGVEDTQGSVVPGKRADILLLSADPLLDINNTRKIETVILQGRLLNRETLNNLLKQ